MSGGVDMDQLQMERAVNGLKEAIHRHTEDTELMRESLARIADSLDDEDGPLARIASALEAIGKQMVEGKRKPRKRNLRAVGA